MKIDWENKRENHQGFSITKRLIYNFILEKNQVYDNIVS
ncbi:hypothetical protein HMPREF9289_1012 [Finegoldia magna BVS033A4]|uniref:Uncharacterized protein n=1 Tax=Finegoldia magna BVS033A4 TaxID=866773 RepID=E1L023_FINMA|nr:hypothetical protein HMPREF9289_1012 [Finegoldia magna BVS033A4]